jgi:ABC-type phosphate/phosphonate transport system permease subunit
VLLRRLLVLPSGKRGFRSTLLWLFRLIVQAAVLMGVVMAAADVV